MRILAGDVGGTKSLFGALQFGPAGVEIESEVRYVSRDQPGIETLMRRAQDDLGGSFDAVGLGLPGPIAHGACFLPKLDWTVRTEQVRAATGIERVCLVNDFVAVGYGIEHLNPNDLLTIQSGDPEPHGPRAILGAGTGLGEGYILWDGQRWNVHPSEGGSTSFGPRNELLARYLLYLRQEVGRGPTWDDVLSGRGLVHLWRFLTESEGCATNPTVTGAIGTGDPAAEISGLALEGADSTCERALDLFIDCYADEAGNQALRFVATGGVYLAGGITPKIAQRLDSDAFRTTFAGDSPLVDLRRRIPVQAVLEARVGLIGAGAAAR